MAEKSLAQRAAEASVTLRKHRETTEVQRATNLLSETLEAAIVSKDGNASKEAGMYHASVNLDTGAATLVLHHVDTEIAAEVQKWIHAQGWTRVSFTRGVVCAYDCVDTPDRFDIVLG